MRRGLASSREEAQDAIAAGRVLVRGAVADKPARQVGADEPVVVSGPPPRFVGRGGEKLDAALDRFAVEVAGRRALDAGASTGGFTDCLLQRGATEVVAVDVGFGQLHERIRGDDRVVVVERTNIRHITAETFGAPFGVVVADLSFISLALVAPTLVSLAADGADLVLLVKPQFEAGRVEVQKGRGIVRDPEVWRRVLQEVQGALETAGAAMMGVMVSPILGGHGNAEFLVHARVGSPATGVDAAALGALVDEAVAAAVVLQGA